jgi:hypothetical protein
VQIQAQADSRNKLTGSNTRRIAKELLAECGVKFMLWDKSDADEDLLETSVDVSEADLTAYRPLCDAPAISSRRD